jgi:hypothetical protein
MLALAASFLCAGCGGDDGERECNDGEEANSLEGSYCEDTEMKYTQVRVLTVADALRIEYTRPIGTGAEKTLQIILSGGNVVFAPNTEINLIDAGAEVRRILAEAPAPITLTQELEATSTLTLNEYNAAIGSKITGSFAMLFKSGRNLRGKFEATLEDAMPQ